MIQELSGIVKYSETDETGRLSLPALVNYFQDVAELHGAKLGIGYRFLQEQNLAWLLSSWQIVIDRMPDISEEYTLQTWGWKFVGAFGMRNCILLDKGRRPLIRANSNWFLFDTKKQTPVRVPESMISAYGVHPRTDMNYASRKVPDPDGGEKQEAITVVRQNLDTNHHVNNAQYIAMAEDYLPEGFRTSELRVEYKKQARLGDVIVPFVLRREDCCQVSLRGEDGAPYASMQFFGGTDLG